MLVSAAAANCEEDEYDCEDATCISADLRCNGRVNCRFRWDEDECQVSGREASIVMTPQPLSSSFLPFSLQTVAAGQSDHVIIVIVVFTLILSTIFIAFIISCCQKLIRDHKIIRVSVRRGTQ